MRRSVFISASDPPTSLRQPGHALVTVLLQKRETAPEGGFTRRRVSLSEREAADDDAGHRRRTELVELAVGAEADVGEDVVAEHGATQREVAAQASRAQPQHHVLPPEIGAAARRGVEDDHGITANELRRVPEVDHGAATDPPRSCDPAA